MPEKSGVEEELCTPILAGVASGTPCCPEAGITVAANVTIKSKCRCTFMMIPLIVGPAARPRPSATVGHTISKSGNSAVRSKIRLRRSRDREQIVAEAVVIVLGADELLPIGLLLAPARYHVHGLVEGVLVLDLDEDFKEFPVRGRLETLRHAQLLAVWRAEHVDEAHFRRQADRIDDQLTVLVTADRFAEPGWLHIFGVLVGHGDAARERVALPHHVHHLRVLHEIERLRGPEQLSGNAARIAARRRQERHAALAGEHLLVRHAHLLGRPGLEDRVQMVADCNRHLPALAIIIALQRMVGMVLDRPAQPGRWIEPAIAVEGVAAVRPNSDPGPG